MPFGEGRTFAGYTIVRRLGAGGMGEVYLAQHPRLPRSDALKLLGSNVSADPTFRERFLREADLACKLWHPHIVGVHDRGEFDGQLWISMDFVDGADAGSLMAQRYPDGMPQDLVIAIVTAVASALDYAYKQGLLHRDVKPANILITNVDDEDERRILLTDFGIARPIDDTHGLTATNMTLGTMSYTAPEQLKGENLDGRADQYSLAATAYHLLTGTPLFRDSNPAVMIGRHLSTKPPALANTRPDLAPLDPVLAVALAKDRNDRFATCSEFGRALAAPQSHQSAAPTMAAQPPPSPAWYPEPSGQGWQSVPQPTAAAPAGNRQTPLLWVLGVIGVVAALVIIGSLVFVLTRDKGSSPTTASKPGVTDSDGTAPDADPPVDSAPQQQRSWTATIVGTCDEGGTCGVKQRTAPRNAAPRLVQNDLYDGAPVTLVCQTSGDFRESSGRSSSMWYRLDNGAYVNSVYLSLAGSGPPAC